jgi:Na+/phosphate symporter
MKTTKHHFETFHPESDGQAFTHKCWKLLHEVEQIVPEMTIEAQKALNKGRADAAAKHMARMQHIDDLCKMFSLVLEIREIDLAAHKNNIQLMNIQIDKINELNNYLNSEI